jgi:hypothetical protein
VASLIGSDDMLRRLSLLPVAIARLGNFTQEDLDTAAPALPVVAGNDDLRTALGLLLQTGAPALRVVDGDGAVLGRLDFSGIRHALLA